jgi:sulfide:quinone oxidoreductase
MGRMPQLRRSTVVMPRVVELDRNLFVAGQIQLEDLPELARLGIKTIINNRPDGEDPSAQPYALELEAAARPLGMEVINIPFTAQTLTSAEVAEFVDVLQQHGDVPTLAFCRTGNRSSMVWAAARMGLGAPMEEVVGKAERAGFDIRGAAPFLHNLGKMAALK